MSRISFCLLLALVWFFPVNAVRSADARQSGPALADQEESWVTWYGDDYFSSCNGNCGLSFLAGPQVETHMAQIFITKPKPFWDWKYGDSALVSAAFSRRLLTIWNVMDIEPDVGIGKRVGDMHAVQAWAAVYFRWIRFPWDNYLRTSIALSAGLSYAAELPSDSNREHFLNYFSPEVTFAPPEYPQNEFVIRFQHRSTAGFGRTTDPGWQYITGGLRWRF